jgi:hypothetical protein
MAGNGKVTRPHRIAEYKRREVIGEAERNSMNRPEIETDSGYRLCGFREKLDFE